MFTLLLIKFYQADDRHQLKTITQHILFIIFEVDSFNIGLQKRYLERNIFDPLQFLWPMGFQPFQCRRVKGNRILLLAFAENIKCGSSC